MTAVTLDTAATSLCRWLAKATALAVFAIGALVLIGWAFDLGLFKSLRATLVSMKANTALGFCLTGLSLWFAGVSGTDTQRGAFSRGCALLVFAVGLVSLLENLGGWDFGLDQLLVKEPVGAVQTQRPGLMAPNTALCFVLVGLAMWLMSGPRREGQPRRRIVLAGQSLAIIVASIAVLALVGYAYGVPSFEGVRGSTPMALHTAIAFVLAAVGLLCARPDVGAAKTLLGQAQGSVVLRRLLVPILLVPFALGWLRLVGQRAGWYGTAFGVSLTTVSTMFILALLLGLTARALNRAATDRRRAEQERDHFFSLALDLFCIAGEDGFFKTVNPAFSQTLGWSEQELLARPFLDFVHPADVAATLREVERLSAGEPVIHFENRYRCKDGSWRWLAWRAAPGTGSLIYASARDVTDQRRARDELEARVEERTAELARANADLAQHREQLEDLVQERTAELRRIEWLLAKGTAPFATTEESQPMTVQPYGDLTELNRTRLILDAVGQDVLADIVGDYLDLLETSAAVYEQKGEYACGLATSGWCRFMDAASRRLCGTANNQEALICGKWLCHESCWTKASKVTVATGQPVDVECDGGIRLYAVPIRAGVAIVGSINFGYGDPPREPDKQRELAAKYSVNLDELRAQAETYQTRPPYFIDLAKRRLHASARLIGAIVERKQTEQALQEAHDMIRCRAAELGEFNQAMVGREQRIIELKEEVNALCRELERAPSYPPVWRVDG